MFIAPSLEGPCEDWSSDMDNQWFNLRILKIRYLDPFLSKRFCELFSRITFCSALFLERSRQEIS